MKQVGWIFLKVDLMKDIEYNLFEACDEKNDKLVEQLLIAGAEDESCVFVNQQKKEYLDKVKLGLKKKVVIAKIL